MKNILFFVITASLVFSMSFAVPSSGGKDCKYAGVKTCKACHKSKKRGDQYSVWASSKHAKAFTTLQTAEADKIAKKRGSDKPAAETKECLSCHVTGYNVDGAEFGKKFKKEDGVTCEACHGPGSAYKKLHNKKDKKDQAKEACFTVPSISDGSAKNLCVKCHNKNSPSYKGFDLNKFWSKIKHPMPK